MSELSWPIFLLSELSSDNLQLWSWVRSLNKNFWSHLNKLWSLEPPDSHVRRFRQASVKANLWQKQFLLNFSEVLIFEFLIKIWIVLISAIILYLRTDETTNNWGFMLNANVFDRYFFQIFFDQIFGLFRPFFRLYQLDIRLESRRKLGENIRLRRIFICQSESEAKRTGPRLRGAKRSEFASLSP